jgi:UDP-N-acetylmuramate--L-alanine ligase/UDP-N-acetylenolpyruvoylglucosamine reductase
MPDRSQLTRQQLIELLGQGRRRVHFVGIGGSGMSGLARMLAQQGHEVTGCDLAPNGEADRLRQLGVSVQSGHSARHVGSDTDLVVYTSAVNGGNDELLAANDLRVPAVRRGELLAALMNHRNNIAVAGTHGKTTTTAMIAHALTRSDSAPSFCIGAHVPILGSNAQIGGGKYFVAEADESDGTLVGYTPEYAVCLNIEPEHLDHHGSMEQLTANFAAFFAGTLKTVFYCADCSCCAKLAGGLRSTISFGLSPGADYRALDIEPTAQGHRFVVTCRNQRLGEIQLRIPGLQNVVNALAAVAVAEELGVPFDKIAEALGQFTGARRRFERRFDADGIVVADDYAHHPTEIRATVAAARALKPARLLVAFQPHRYSRVALLLDEFAAAFRGADKLWLTDIYAAGEKPIEGISGRTLFGAVVGSGQPAVAFEADLSKIAEALHREAQPGDLILTMGAGDIYKVAGALADKLRPGRPQVLVSGQSSAKLAMDLKTIVADRGVLRRDEPMAQHTSFRIGGPAEFWIEPNDEKTLSRLLRYCHERQVPVTIVGRGTNLLVRDAGIAGAVIHLGRAFSRIEVDGDRLVARAGAQLRSVVNKAREHELGGLEFLEGIPGSLGGALRMNAGAMGRQTFDVVEWVRYISFAGDVYDADPRSFPVSYRSCPLFSTHIALSAILRGEKTPRPTIDAKLRSYAARRWATQPNQPSAGCVFKNPAAVSAGKLIDEMGLKGRRLGGALVSPKHGNFIVNAGGATADDVLRLIQEIRNRIRAERGIELEQEVMVVGRE